MSRVMPGVGDADGDVFRAVLEFAYPADYHYKPWAGTTRTDGFGPYARVGAAKATLTRELGRASYASRHGVTVTGRVERGRTTWEPLE